MATDTAEQSQIATSGIELDVDRFDQGVRRSWLLLVCPRGPKSIRRGLVFPAKARAAPRGYVVELAVPLASVGISRPREACALRLDLACNDRIEEDPLLPVEGFSLANLYKIVQGEKAPLDSIYDPEGIGLEEGNRILERAYFAWLWSGTRDLGYPSARHPVSLVGRPALHEALASRLGAWRLPLALVAITAVAHIRGHLGENISVAGQAHDLAVSPRTLQRSLQESLNCSPSELILAAKMQVARELLVRGGLRVGEVADRVGFENPYHFSRRFKAYYGVPPSRYASQGRASGAD
jgi:AraC-like DNA-binding protein